jgi:hypothetical protein
MGFLIWHSLSGELYARLKSEEFDGSASTDCIVRRWLNNIRKGDNLVPTTVARRIVLLAMMIAGSIARAADTVPELGRFSAATHGRCDVIGSLLIWPLFVCAGRLLAAPDDLRAQLKTQTDG